MNHEGERNDCVIVGKLCVGQFEGAAKEGNKGASIWDTFTRQPGKIKRLYNNLVLKNIRKKKKKIITLLNSACV